MPGTRDIDPRYLKGSLWRGVSQSQRSLQSSLMKFDDAEPIIASKNGFVHGAIKVYSNHQNLVIRSEGIWFAILTQLSSYINGHTEQLRGQFVAHEGKKRLVLRYESNMDFGKLAMEMGELLEINVVDPELREWIMLDLSTTTKEDEILASILMMGAFKGYFTYVCRTGCGFPSVTLLGEKEDWERLLQKLEKLKTFGEDTTKWYHLLVPIVSRFVRTFDEPKSKDIIHFRNRIAHCKGRSGSTYYCGWITAFCYWDKQGHCLYDAVQKAYTKNDEADTSQWKHSTPRLRLEDAIYERINVMEVPIGFSIVPIRLEDGLSKYDALIIAGSVGWKWSASGEISDNGKMGLDTVQPATGWWMFEQFSLEDREKVKMMTAAERKTMEERFRDFISSLTPIPSAVASWNIQTFNIAYDTGIFRYRHTRDLEAQLNREWNNSDDEENHDVDTAACGEPDIVLDIPERARLAELSCRQAGDLDDTALLQL
ncbi:MAG: hypothetical protein MMC33_003320 [Icmadophila ericetorum]|nr:hypothetical protein [Icmadophila ericetorum]